MELGNLLSGFLGAVLALILAEVWRLLLLAKDRKKKRNIFVAYIQNVIKPGLEKYIHDIDRLKEHLKSYPNEATIYEQHEFDMLPSLNSDIFKEIGFNELYFLSTKYNLHEKVIDIYHCIDYLKASMAFEIHKNFIDHCDSHFEEKGCKSVNDIIEHSKSCVTIIDFKKLTIGNLDARLLSAFTSLDNCKMLIEKL